MIRQHPLSWPPGRERTLWYHTRRASFADITIPAAAEQLARELRLLGADETLRQARLTLNAPKPGSRAQPSDPGVAVWFRLNGQDISLSCDAWDRVEHNIRALVLHIEALRGMERWHVGTMQQALRGYLVAPQEEPWWEVLGVAPTASQGAVEAAFRTAALQAHPDRGGSAEALTRLTRAREKAREAQP